MLTHRTVINALQASLLLLLSTSSTQATQTASIDRLVRAEAQLAVEITNPFDPRYKASTNTNQFAAKTNTNPFAVKTSPVANTNPFFNTNPFADTTTNPSNMIGKIETCGICFADDVRCYSFDETRSCGHSYCAECIPRHINIAMERGDFPAYCPGCKAEEGKHVRIGALICNKVIQALADAGVIEQEGTYGAARFQRLQDKATGVTVDIPSDEKMNEDEHQKVVRKTSTKVDQDTADYLSSMTKPCPGCGLPTAKYLNHGCHHIQGCTNCGLHWCYVCQKPYEEIYGHYQANCACSRYCDNSCDCPICPECKPGDTCDFCENGGCPACNPETKSQFGNETASYASFGGGAWGN